MTQLYFVYRLVNKVDQFSMIVWQQLELHMISITEDRVKLCTQLRPPPLKIPCTQKLNDSQLAGQIIYGKQKRI